MDPVTIDISNGDNKYFRGARWALLLGVAGLYTALFIVDTERESAALHTVRVTYEGDGVVLDRVDLRFLPDGIWADPDADKGWALAVHEDGASTPNWVPAGYSAYSALGDCDDGTDRRPYENWPGTSANLVAKVTTCASRGETATDASDEALNQYVAQCVVLYGCESNQAGTTGSMTRTCAVAVAGHEATCQNRATCGDRVAGTNEANMNMFNGHLCMEENGECVPLEMPLPADTGHCENRAYAQNMMHGFFVAWLTLSVIMAACHAVGSPTWLFNGAGPSGEMERGAFKGDLIASTLWGLMYIATAVTFTAFTVNLVAYASIVMDRDIATSDVYHLLEKAHPPQMYNSILYTTRVISEPGTGYDLLVALLALSGTTMLAMTAKLVIAALYGPSLRKTLWPARGSANYGGVPNPLWAGMAAF